MNYWKPRETFKKLLLQWWRFTSRQLRLTSFMFNGSYPEEEGTHVRKTWKAWLLREKAPIDNHVYGEVGLDQGSVVFQRDGQWVRAPKYDTVPVIPGRRMLIPVDPVTGEALDEEERRLGHPAASDSGDEEHTTTIVYTPPHFRWRVSPGKRMTKGELFFRLRPKTFFQSDCVVPDLDVVIRSDVSLCSCGGTR